MRPFPPRPVPGSAPRRDGIFVKVLLSAFQCCPDRGSEPGIGWHWATALTEIGHDVTVLTASAFREPILAVDPQGIDFRFIDFPRSPLHHFSYRAEVYDVYLRWQAAALKHVQESQQQYDVAHHVVYGGLHLGSMLWKLPIPLIYGPIGGGQTAPANYWRYFGADWPAERVRTALTGPLLKLNRCRQTIRNAAVTLVCNSETEVASRRLGARDVRFMLPDGLPGDGLAGARRQPTGIPTVFWVGRLLPRKAPVLAIEAFAELRRTMPARMVIAGDGPMRAQVHATVERLGLTQDVEILGGVPLDDVMRLYDSASVFLFTSLRESFGTPFLEALGRGLPTVALSLGGIADADVGPAALKIKLTPRPRDLPGQIATALRTVLRDKKWELRSEAAVKWAAEWTWPIKAASATKIYQEIAAMQSLMSRIAALVPVSPADDARSPRDRHRSQLGDPGSGSRITATS
jgi:glycosyltransferase involved in cell wall biosynthesis